MVAMEAGTIMLSSTLRPVTILSLSLNMPTQEFKALATTTVTQTLQLAPSLRLVMLFPTQQLASRQFSLPVDLFQLLLRQLRISFSCIQAELSQMLVAELTSIMQSWLLATAQIQLTVATSSSKIHGVQLGESRDMSELALISRHPQLVFVVSFLRHQSPCNCDYSLIV
jgi:hypothetical protein